MVINLHLFGDYKSHLRNAGTKSLRSLGFFDDMIDELSTPLLSEVYYNRNSLSRIRILELIQLDSDRKLEKILTQEMEEALEIISTVWPEFRLLIRLGLERVVKRKAGEKFESWSDPKRFGEIVFSYKRTTVLDWIEILIHEVTHIYLFAVTSQKKFMKFKNLRQMRYSAIRETERPIIGIFHGLAVEANIVYISNLMLNSNGISIEKDKILKMQKSFLTKFLQDFQVIENEGLHKFDSMVEGAINSILKNNSLKRAYAK